MRVSISKSVLQFSAASIFLLGSYIWADGIILSSRADSHTVAHHVTIRVIPTTSFRSDIAEVHVNPESIKEVNLPNKEKAYSIEVEDLEGAIGQVIRSIDFRDAALDIYKTYSNQQEKRAHLGSGLLVNKNGTRLYDIVIKSRSGDLKVASMNLGLKGGEEDVLIDQNLELSVRFVDM